MTVFRLDLLNKELCQYNAEEEGAATKRTAPFLSVPLVTPQYRFVWTFTARACLKNAFCQMFGTVCGRFVPNEGGVGGQRHKGQCLA
jgi:hypothetical protein